MLIYALQINDLCIGLHAIEKLITNTQNKLQQSQWVLLRAIFEATIKLSYLCCDTKMTKIRSEELNHAGVIDQLKSMKALFSAFPSDEKGVLAIAHLEEKIKEFPKIKILNMEQRLEAISRVNGNTDFAKQLNIYWQRLCAISHGRPSELFKIFIGNNRVSFEPFAKINKDDVNEFEYIAAFLLSITCECLVNLSDKAITA